MELDGYEKRRIEDRAFKHWHDQKAEFPHTSEWASYWKVNKRSWMKNGRMFKGLLTPENFERYLLDHRLNPWTIWNCQNLNGGTHGA